MSITIAMPQMGNDLFRKYMKSKYVDGIRRAGAFVKWIDLENTDSAVAEALECDGLLLPGGADLEPLLYYQQRQEKCGKANPLRDKGEMEILAAFIKTGKPILCICRGLQVLNVFFGGTLHQDIAHLQKVKHSDFMKRASHSHSITVEEASLLHSIVAEKEIQVNSIHHQSADKIGDGLVVTALSSDGIIEALEMPSHPFCLALQWHPEHMCKNNSQQQKIFDTFVSRCKKQ